MIIVYLVAGFYLTIRSNWESIGCLSRAFCLYYPIRLKPWLTPLVIVSAVRFSSPDYTPANQRSLCLCDDRGLALAVMLIVEVDHQQVASAPQLVSPGRIRIQDGEVPIAPLSV